MRFQANIGAAFLLHGHGRMPHILGRDEGRALYAMRMGDRLDQLRKRRAVRRQQYLQCCATFGLDPKDTRP